MTRLYIQPSWIDSCSDHGEWSGGNDQYRGDKSIEGVPTYINGKPNVKAFSDEAIEARKEKKKTSTPLVDRILPQQRRVRTLTEQLMELEAERKAGMDIHTYSKLRDILIVKRDRAEELLKKATSVRPIREETEEVGVESAYETDDLDHINRPVAAKQSKSSWVVDFIDELPSTNYFRKPLKIACTVVMKALQFTQATKQYIKTLQEV
jgi:hypothetical protein